MISTFNVIIDSSTYSRCYYCKPHVHVFYTSNIDVYKHSYWIFHFYFLRKSAIFTSPNLYEGLIFNNLQTPHLTVEHLYAMFITTLHKPSYFVMGLAPSIRGVSPLSPLPVVPLQCSLYVEYPADLNDYITGTCIDVYVTLNLKTIELVSIHNQRLIVYNTLTKPCIVQRICWRPLIVISINLSTLNAALSLSKDFCQIKINKLLEKQVTNKIPAIYTVFQ